MSTYLTVAEAAERAGMNVDQLRVHMGRQHIRQYVRWEDIELTLAAVGQRGVHATRCAQHPKPHWWDPKLREVDPVTGEPLNWCGRRGCTVGVVMVPDGKGGLRPLYRHRYDDSNDESGKKGG